MASYPTSVKTFATRSNGGTIDASHVNDLQDEVNAIEDGILNGTAPLNSSNSTVANLSVSGGSTLGGAVVISTGGLTVSTGDVALGEGLTVAGNSTFSGSISVAGNSTFDGDLTVTGTITGVATKLAAEVTNSGGQTMTNAAWTGLTWDTENFDVGDLHSTASNSSRITMTSTGVWACGCSIEWPGNSTGQRRLRILRNDTTAEATIIHEVINGAAVVPMTIQTMVRAQSTTDYLTAVAWTNNSTNIDLTGASTSGYKFWATHLSS